VYPENRIDPTNPLGIRHCRRQDFPLLEFSTFENSCFNMTDIEMVEGTECQFECDTGTFDIGAFDNKVICECHIAHPGHTMKSCFWHIPHGIPGHDDYMCGKPLIDTIFAQSAANVDNIRLEHENCEATIGELVRNKGHDLDHYIDDTEKAIVQLWKDMASEIKAREQRDYDINLAIKDAELEATKYYLREAIYANVTVQNYARDRLDSIEVEIAQNITMTEYQVNSDLDDTIRNLKTEMAMRTLTWEQELKDQVDAEAATIKDDALQFIAAETATLKTAIDTSINDYEGPKTTEIQGLGNTLQTKHDNLMANALASLQDATTGEVTAKIAALKTSTKEIIDAQREDMHKYNLLEAGLLTQVNTDGVVTDADTGDKAFDKDLSYAVIIDDPDYGIAAYGAIQETYIEDNTGEAKIKGCGDETCVEGYLDANGPTLRTEVEDELAKKQAEIADKNAVSRANALAAAQLYADDIQNLLEIDIQNRIHNERFSLTNTMTGYENSMRSQLDDAEEQIAEDLQKASDIYTGSIDGDFQMKEDMVQSANSTMNTNLDELRSNFCDQITHHQTRTLGIIDYQKSEVANKIARLVAKVKFEMEHSKKQLKYLRANYYF